MSGPGGRPARLAALAGLVAIEVIGSVLARQDLSQRSDGQVRGPKGAWRLILAANPGNCVLYWVWGAPPVASAG